MNEKVKAINPQIVVHGTVEKPYYEISYYDTTDNKWHIGYSSYDLQTVKKYLDNCFEIIEADGGKMSKYCPHCGAIMKGENNG